MGESLDKCYYRKAPPKGYPPDYYLWPKHQKECKGKKSCAPDFPPVPMNAEEIKSFAREAAPDPDLKKLPEGEEELKRFLIKAKQDGKIIFFKKGSFNGKVLHFLQREIDASRDKDVFFIVGAGHGIYEQAEFVNFLITKLKRINLLVLESEKAGYDNPNLQSSWDNFLIFGKSYPITLFSATSYNEHMALNMRGLIAQDRCLNVVLANIPAKAKDDLIKKVNSYTDHITSRDIFTVNATGQKLLPEDSGKRNAVFIECGATHADRRRLPAFFRQIHPKSRVVTVVVNGGKHVKTLTFDRAVKALGWENDNFILNLKKDKFIDAEIVVRLATDGRETMEAIAPGVLQQLFDPLK